MTPARYHVAGSYVRFVAAYGEVRVHLGLWLGKWPVPVISTQSLGRQASKAELH